MRRFDFELLCFLQNAIGSVQNLYYRCKHGHNRGSENPGSKFDPYQRDFNLHTGEGWQKQQASKTHGLAAGGKNTPKKSPPKKKILRRMDLP